MGYVWATNITKALWMGLLIQEDSSMKKIIPADACSAGTNRDGTQE